MLGAGAATCNYRQLQFFNSHMPRKGSPENKDFDFGIGGWDSTAGPSALTPNGS